MTSNRKQITKYSTLFFWGLLNIAALSAKNNGVLVVKGSCRVTLSDTFPVSKLRFEHSASRVKDPAQILQAEALKRWSDIEANPRNVALIESSLADYKTAWDPVLDPKLGANRVMSGYISPWIGHSPDQMWGVPAASATDSKLLIVSSPASSSPKHRVRLEQMSPRAAIAHALGFAQASKAKIEEVLLFDLARISNEEISNSGLPMLRLRPIRNNQGRAGAGGLEYLANPIVTALGRLKSQKAYLSLEKLFNGLGHYASQTDLPSIPKRYRTYTDKPSPIALIDSLYAIDPKKAVETFLAKMTEIQSVHAEAAGRRNDRADLVWQYMNWPQQLWQRAIGSEEVSGIFSAADRRRVLQDFESFEDIQAVRNVGPAN